VRVGGVEDGRPDVIRMRSECVDAALGRQVPEFDGVVVRGRDDLGLVRREVRDVNRSGVS
jgi:hypothetical protein